MTLQKTSRYVLFDMPNTLFDSRHRMGSIDYYITDIHNDKLSYPAYCLMKDFLEQGYKVILTHYCLSRLRHKVEMLLKHNYMQDKYYRLFTNFQTQDVTDNASLKKHLYENVLSNVDVAYIVDNDPNMLTYWLQQETCLLQVPLGIY